MNGLIILFIILGYFTILTIIARVSAKKGGNDAFFRGNGNSPWWLVAIGMIGTSISGVTFVSVPGMPKDIGMSYMQMVLGFTVGYIIIAKVLLPLYYKLNLISIYKYLDERFGSKSYKIGAVFFIISKITGAAARLFLVVLILQSLIFNALGVPFEVTTISIIFLIWLYSNKGGIRSIVRTDAVQTIILLTTAALIIYIITSKMGLGFRETVSLIKESNHSNIFVFDDWASKQNFFKQFLSGIFITIVMTGLDQDMMQKNLTIKSLKEAQRNMYIYGVAFIPINLIFLCIGILLLAYANHNGIVIPENGDEILPLLATFHLGGLVMILFCIGIVAAAFSSADSALTSLTTSFCLDIMRIDRMEDKRAEKFRKLSHIGMAVLFALIIMAIRYINSDSVIDAIYTIAGYTYGPLLGLFAYGLICKGMPNDKLIPWFAIASPILCFALSYTLQNTIGYKTGYELLMINASITFLMLWVSSAKHKRLIIKG
ncbi:MAG: sodium:solute symporter [Bacteroidales bacterium]|nr:sodium:solute symporter [Bacteroidales bacterium]